MLKVVENMWDMKMGFKSEHVNHTNDKFAQLREFLHMQTMKINCKSFYNI